MVLPRRTSLKPSQKIPPSRRFKIRIDNYQTPRAKIRTDSSQLLRSDTYGVPSATGSTSKQSQGSDKSELESPTRQTVLSGDPRKVIMTIIAQSPMVRRSNGSVLTAQVAVPVDRLRPGPRSHRFAVVEHCMPRRGTPLLARLTIEGQATYAEWTFEDQFGTAVASNSPLELNAAFHAQQVYAVAARTLDVFERTLGRRLNWAFKSHQLGLITAGDGSGFNAQYVRAQRSVNFGFDESVSPTRYASTHHDLIAHEVTHAVLDGLRPRYWGRGSLDQAAFHEAFADIVALLSVFSLPEVMNHALTHSGAKTRIAAANVSETALKESILFTIGSGSMARRSVMMAPTGQWKRQAKYLEEHNRGEILVAAVMQSLLAIWLSRLQPLIYRGSLDRDRAGEEGAKAARHVLTMCIRAIDYTPPVEFEFADYLDALLFADEVVVPDDPRNYRALFADKFRAFGIVAPRREVRNMLARNAPVVLYQSINFDALRTDRDEVYRFMWQNGKYLGLDLELPLFVDRVRHALRVGPDGQIVNEVIADYSQILTIKMVDFKKKLKAGQLKGKAAALSDDVILNLWGGGTLIFDEFGRVRAHQLKLVNDWRRQVGRVTYLVASGKSNKDGSFGAKEAIE